MDMLRTIIPANTEIVWGGIVAVGGTALSNFLGWDQSLEVLLVAMVIDYVTGVLAAYINPHMALNSQKGFKGICGEFTIQVQHL